MLIRRETPADVDAIRDITTRAFAPSTTEASLVDELRVDPGWLPALSLVAEVNGRVVGHVACTRAWIDGQPVLGLGPLSVDLPHQGTGVGSALVHAALGAADALDEPIVVLLGNPAYYQRFGFVLAAMLGVDPPVPEWAPDFQVRPLSAYLPTLRGAFVYAEPFQRVP